MADNDDGLGDVMGRIRNELLDALKQHQYGCGVKAPERCPEPMNVIAFLAHAAGLRPDDLDQVRVRLQEYGEFHDEAHDHDHPGGVCPSNP